ncbi:YqaJ viral recombinase family protein [Hungatella sp.]|uniref:YqaJ viral recombinase family nuclease n=1 Tax=Hungatella sp. TaxID=2613924 RepID=UPI0039953B9A
MALAEAMLLRSVEFPPWKTARDLYEEKLNHLSPPEDGWVAKEIGKRLEELVVQIFMKRTGLKPYAVRKMFRHPLYPFMMANVDFFVEIEGGIYIIECKTSFSYHMDQWEDGKIPRHYELQGRHYMAVTNVQGVIFLCLHGNSEDTFIERRLDRDLDQEEELIEQEAYFWNHCVQMGKPPAYTESADLVLKSIRERLEIREKQQIELPEQLSENVAAFLKLKEKKSELDQQSKRLDEQIKLTYAPIQEALKGAERGLLVVDGTTYQAGYTKRSVTSINKQGMEALRLLHPDICQEYAKTNVSYSFYIKPAKAG